MPTENLLQAAGRHIQDAQVLFEHQRYDNAAYISAYSVECILKLMIDYHTKTHLSKSYSHDLFELNEATTSKLLVVFPQINNLSTLTQEQLQLLAQGHPERRYWSNNYLSVDDAQLCVTSAENLYTHTISNFILDGHYSISEV